LFKFLFKAKPLLFKAGLAGLMMYFFLVGEYWKMNKNEAR